MASDKFILMGLDDERSKDVAEVLGNKTCKKILDYLSDRKEASEKDISDGLKIPINTAEYNLNKLVKSGLVEKSKNFFWSTRGKKIEMFKLARKHIIISPSKRFDFNNLKALLPVLFVAFAVIALALYLDFREYNAGKMIPENNLKYENNSRAIQVSAAVEPGADMQAAPVSESGIKAIYRNIKNPEFSLKDIILILLEILIIILIIFLIAKNYNNK